MNSITRYASRRLAEVGDLDDVRVVDAVDGARLAEEALAVRGVARQVLPQDS